MVIVTARAEWLGYADGFNLVAKGCYKFNILQWLQYLALPGGGMGLCRCLL